MGRVFFLLEISRRIRGWLKNRKEITSSLKILIRLGERINDKDACKDVE